jgi:hypothetical protein
MEIERGEFAEGMPWQLHRPYVGNVFWYLADAEKPLPCPHAFWVDEPLRLDNYLGDQYGWRRHFNVPVAAACFNESGYSETVLCLMCADDARATDY